MFNIGDRVRILEGWSPVHAGKDAVVVTPKPSWHLSHHKEVAIRIDGYDYLIRADAHCIYTKYLELATPLSPFDAAVRAYITSELAPHGV